MKVLFHPGGSTGAAKSARRVTLPPGKPFWQVQFDLLNDDRPGGPLLELPLEDQ